MPSLPTKVSHARRNVAVIGVAVIIILMVAILAASTSSGPSGTTTSSEVQEGGTVTIGQAIIVKFGENEVPVRFIFNSASFNGTIGEFHATPDSGYRFLVLDVSVRNVGNGEVQTYMVGDKWEVTVDKGYVYQEFFSFGTVQTPSFTLRPEEEKVGYIVFEILKDATPLEVRYYKPSGNSPSIILNLRGYAFQTTTSAAQEYLQDVCSRLVKDRLVNSSTDGQSVQHTCGFCALPYGFNRCALNRSRSPLPGKSAYTVMFRD